MDIENFAGVTRKIDQRVLEHQAATVDTNTKNLEWLDVSQVSATSFSQILQRLSSAATDHLGTKPDARTSSQVQ